MSGSKWNDPSLSEVRASFQSPENTALARAVHSLLTWVSYDKHQAHRWALRLIKASPKTGEDVAEALTNFDWMIEAARASYASSARESAKLDKVLDTYRRWCGVNSKQEA